MARTKSTNHSSNVQDALKGCYGSQVKPSEMKQWLKENIIDNIGRKTRISLNVMGAPGCVFGDTLITVKKISEIGYHHIYNKENIVSDEAEKEIFQEEAEKYGLIDPSIKEIKLGQEVDIKISDFFKLVMKRHGMYAVKIPSGEFVLLGSLIIKRNMPSCKIITDDGNLGCSKNHLLMTENGWKMAGNINVFEDKIQVNGKFIEINEIEFIESSDTYDFEVLSDEHAYLANGFTSHNTGKTDIVKSLEKEPIEWNGKHYDGFQVIDIPLAQIEEMGDVLGYPVEEIKMIAKDGTEKWIKAVDSMIKSYMDDGWHTDNEQRTIYAPPSWVPKEERPGVLLFDDGNRASQRIIKGLMQLVQDYRTISWKIPNGWTIVFTGNPDNRFNQVTSMDTAQLTRMKFITPVPDAQEWAVWAENNNIDHRLISFILKYPEMMIGEERTNPRSLAEFGRALRRFPRLDGESFKKCLIEAKASLDDSTIDTMMVFFQKDVELVIDPKDILEDFEHTAKKRLDDLMTRSEPRIDIVNVINDRLYAYIVSDDYKFKNEHVANVQAWILADNLPKDTAYAFVRRLCYSDSPYKRQMLSGNKKLMDIVKIGFGKMF